MDVNPKSCLLAAIVVLCGVVYCSAVEVPHPTDPTYDADCIVNSTLPATADDNYYDCQTDESVEAGTTDCCALDRKVGCCVPEGALGRMAKIGIGMACGTVFLMTLTFIYNWCDVQTFPCLKTCKVKCRGCCCKGCRRCPCLREDDDDVEIVKVRISEHDMVEAPPAPPAYDTPDELKQDVKDDFFA